MGAESETTKMTLRWKTDDRSNPPVWQLVGLADGWVASITYDAERGLFLNTIDKPNSVMVLRGWCHDLADSKRVVRRTYIRSLGNPDYRVEVKFTPTREALAIRRLKQP